MTTRYRIIIITIFMSIVSASYSQSVRKIEPLCWWEGMNTELQLMLYGENLRNSSVRIIEKGMEVIKVHHADSPNYLFVDVRVNKSGKYTIELENEGKTIRQGYEILRRKPNSALRKGFDTSDVIYLLMPDRFANGDTSNDLVENEQQILDRNSLTDRHGGDIQGIINHLDYIADLGVTTIWPTPLLEDKLYYHQYACSDFYQVDSHLGTNELYKEMVSKAHDNRLKIIQDAVINHCSSEHEWMKDLPFKDWVNLFDTYTSTNLALNSFSDPYSSADDKEICKRGWFVESMPDMNLSNPFVMKYFVQMAIWWIEYADLDGLRVDTYFYMGEETSDWTQGIRNEYPQMAIVGEVWGNEPPVISHWLEKDKSYQGFNSHLPMAMDFPLERALVMGLSHDNEAWGGGVKSIYNLISQDFVYSDSQNSLVVFADNHDIDRIYNMLGKSLAKTKMALTFVLTTRGTPQIYYGTELLFENDERGGAHQGRPDFPGGWEEDSINLFEEKDRSARQQEMFDHIRNILKFRKNAEVLHNGKLMHYVPEENVYTYFRYNDKECVMVIINASQQAKKVKWERFAEHLSDKADGIDILNQEIIKKDDKLELDAESSIIIHFKKQENL